MPISDSNTSNRAKWLETTLLLLRQDLEEDRFADAMGHFRQALALSRGVKDLRTLVNEATEEQAFKLLPRNWRVAEVMLQEAAAAEPAFRADSEVQDKLRRAREDEALTLAIYRTDRIGLEGRTETARVQLGELAALHPDDARIKERLYALDHPQAVADEPESVAAPPVTAAPQPAVAAVAMRPPESELDLEGTPNETDDVKQIQRRTKFLIAHSTWTTIKNFSVLAAATSMLGLAALLLWQHFSASVPSKRVQLRALMPERPVAPAAPQSAAVTLKPVAAPDDEAWELVKMSNDPALLRDFLSAYPTSPHASRIRAKLSAMDWAKVDKSNIGQVKAYLKLHPLSPYRAAAESLLAAAQPAAAAIPADRDAILDAVRTYRQNKQETFPPGSDGVLDEPAIEGDRATLRYHAKGTAGPLDYSFALAKQDGVWTVESVH